MSGHWGFPVPAEAARPVARAFSRLIAAYLRHTPAWRGSWSLRRFASPWLVARLDNGPWIRVSGIAEFEWSALLGDAATEPATRRLFRSLVKPGFTVVDVGANVGYYALTAAAAVGPTGRVVAFEPGPAVAARLQENVDLNGFTNISVVRSAVADRIGELHLRVGEDSEGSSLYDVGEPSTRLACAVPVTTLDDYVRTAGILLVDVLKIDAEGAEVSILRGARGILSGPGAPLLFIEANPMTLEAAGESVHTLRAEIESLGYTITIVEVIPWSGVSVEDWLATRP